MRIIDVISEQRPDRNKLELSRLARMVRRTGHRLPGWFGLPMDGVPGLHTGSEPGDAEGRGFHCDIIVPDHQFVNQVVIRFDVYPGEVVVPLGAIVIFHFHSSFVDQHAETWSRITTTDGFYQELARVLSGIIGSRVGHADLDSWYDHPYELGVVVSDDYQHALTAQLAPFADILHRATDDELETLCDLARHNG